MLRGSLVLRRHASYLGLPTYIGRIKKAVFSTIQDQVWKKIKGWKEKFLSKAGKEILLKAVVQAIPTYITQCFEIPKTVYEHIKGLCRRFWWSHDSENRGIAWVGWAQLCNSKKNGGLGFHNFCCFNRALLAKQC